MAKNSINEVKLGFTVGIFAALMHAIWALTVFAGVAQGVLDWVFPMHFLNNVYSVIGFNFLVAIALTVMAFIGGFVMGWLFGFIWNYIDKAWR